MAAPLGNQYAVGNPGGGRPNKFTSAADLYIRGTEYIDKTLAEEKHLTFTGVLLALRMDRITYNDYMGGKFDDDSQEFSKGLKELKLRCENYAESRLFGNNPTGAIFALKNYGWKDVSTIENTGPNGGPLLIQSVNAMSDADLRLMVEIMERASIVGEIVDIKPDEE
jgi:hypothetical protein